MFEQVIRVYVTSLGHVDDGKSDHSVYPGFAVGGYPITQSVAGNIKDVAHEGNTVGMKDIGTDVGILHVCPQW